MAEVSISMEVERSCIDGMSELLRNRLSGMSKEESIQYTEIVKTGGAPPIQTQDYKITPENPTDGEQASEQEVARQMANNVMYFSDIMARRQATTQDIEKTFGGNEAQPQTEAQKQVQRTWGTTTPQTQVIEKTKKKVVKRVKERKTTFEKGKALIGDKDVSFTAAYKPMDWTIDDFSSESPLKNAERLRNLVSKLVFDTAGGWSNVRELYVSDSRIIVNGVMVIPQVTSSVIERLPMDSAEYIKNGMLAELFNWGFLRKMVRLSTLGIDSIDLFCKCISDDLGYSRTANVKSLFNACEALRVLYIGNERIGLEDLDTSKTSNTNRDVAKHFRFANLMDGYQLNVYKATDGMQNWAVNSLKNYANNRGNKFILWWWGGLLARGAGAGITGVANMGAHLIGGIFKTVKSAINDTKSQ